MSFDEEPDNEFGDIAADEGENQYEGDNFMEDNTNGLGA